MNREHTYLQQHAELTHYSPVRTVKQCKTLLIFNLDNFAEKLNKHLL